MSKEYEVEEPTKIDGFTVEKEIVRGGDAMHTLRDVRAVVKTSLGYTIEAKQTDGREPVVVWSSLGEMPLDQAKEYAEAILAAVKAAEAFADIPKTIEPEQVDDQEKAEE